jgi:hypothetical protein
MGKSKQTTITLYRNNHFHCIFFIFSESSYNLKVAVVVKRLQIPNAFKINAYLK